MKKAKFMLAAIAVLAVVGGSLAFKASIHKTLFVGSALNNCPLQIDGVTTAANVGLSTSTFAGPAADNCAKTTIYATAD